ncbi:hypothetical protein DEJ23_05115 [Curtobacterium sp. MCSS17_008]|uniref:hypothetical protein n=1 Tax=Curtobacterium sp. MCSS17_008 TaxID=2175647 RepID=UPI000DA73D04|nr:hypothetical protein [Curtobacterium sp. MCSS17_008]PZF58267.1 hypothetical protein DEJ23_05115 [Curtobacterium sp. MCSS17_008]
MRAPASRLALIITLLFLAGGALVVVLAVVVLVRDGRDDAAWAAVLLGAGVAAWGLWFHQLTDEEHTPAGAEPQAARNRVGTVAMVAVLAGGAYWTVRGPLDRTVAESLLVTAIVLGLWALNRGLDARIRRRRAASEVD